MRYNALHCCNEVFSIVVDWWRRRLFTMWLFFFVPETEPFMKARFIQTINLQGLQKLSTRKTLMSTDRKNCYFLWFLVLTRWIFLSTCGLGKFQIPSNFAESSWSSGCGLNLCHHTNYIFTQPKKQQERKNFLRNKIQLTQNRLNINSN